MLLSAVEAAGAPPDATVSLTLSDDAELAMLNAAHMGKSGPTDVLSFPLAATGPLPRASRAGPGSAHGRSMGSRCRRASRLHLGDVIVSVERAIEQASSGAGGQTSDVRWAPADELRLLITHGGLHICGWDHADAEEEGAMRALERADRRRLAAVATASAGLGRRRGVARAGCPRAG